MQDLLQKLQRFREQHIIALSHCDFPGGFKAYEAKLADELERTLPPEEVNDDTLEDIVRIFVEIREIAHQFFSMRETYHKMTETFTEAVNSYIENEKLAYTKRSPSPDNYGLPPYIAPAYRWLLDNLHDPYPSSSMRNSLAQESAATRKSIDGWFIDIRKRIGWTTLRAKRFNGKKEAIIRAAKAFFSEGVEEHALHFTSIRHAAYDLYSEKLRESALASQMTNILEKNHSSSTCTPTLAYPSPETQSPSLPSTPVVNSKKRLRSVEIVDDEDSIADQTRALTKDHSHSYKRRRTQPPQRAASLPSPTSPDKSPRLTTNNQTLRPYQHLPKNKSSRTNQRRCASDSRAQNPPKYSSTGIKFAGLQTVSGTYPNCAASTTTPLNRSDVHGPATSQIEINSLPISTPVPEISTFESLAASEPFCTPYDSVPTFPLDMPENTSCQQPVGSCMVDMALYYPETLPRGLENTGSLPDQDFSAFDIVPLPDTSATSMAGEMDAFWSSLLESNNYQSNDLSTASLIPILSEVDIHLNPFFQFDAVSPPEQDVPPTSAIPTLFSSDSKDDNIFHDAQVVPSHSKLDRFDGGQVAEIETLKKQQEEITRRIQHLERMSAILV